MLTAEAAAWKTFMHKGKNLNIKRKIVIALAAVLLCAVSVTALQTNTAHAAEKPKTYLFIGNSLTHYNNMPKMYQQITKAATGKEIEYQALSYGGRTLSVHSAAITAVIRTKGKAALLTEKEKELFCLSHKKTFSVDVFNGYKTVLLNKDGSVKKYDFIVLQEATTSEVTDYEAWKKAAIDLLNALNTPRSKIILYASHARWDAANYQTLQDTIDHNAKKVRKQILLNTDYSSVRIAYTGRAFVKYWNKFGPDKALKLFPESYEVYPAPPCNDLILGDLTHPTQLGTYLITATIFSEVYHINAKSSIKKNQATSPGSMKTLSTLRGGYNYARLSGPFPSKRYLKKLCKIAYQTSVKNKQRHSTGSYTVRNKK